MDDNSVHTEFPKVTAFNAESLGKRCGFSEVEIRECLEGVNVADAMDVMEWANNRPDSFPALRNWAYKYKQGFYRNHRELADGSQNARTEQEYMLSKEAEQVDAGGGRLTQSRMEDLARTFHAPQHRALQYKIQRREAARERGREDSAGTE